MNIKPGIALIAGCLLTACMHEAEPPADVAQHYWTALSAGDTATAKKYVSTASRQSLQDYITLPDEKKIPLQEVHIGEQHATVTTIIPVAGDAEGNYHSFDTVLVMENGQWKIDAANSQPPAPDRPAQKQLDELGEQLSESAKKNMESIDEAVTEGIQMLNEALREGSSEMGNSLLRGMEQLNQKMRESIDKMKQRRNIDSEPEKKQDKDKGEGMI